MDGIVILRDIITLEALGAFSFLPNDIKDLVDELGTLGVIWKTRVR